MLCFVYWFHLQLALPSCDFYLGPNYLQGVFVNISIVEGVNNNMFFQKKLFEI